MRTAVSGDSSWYTVLEQNVDAAVVTNTTMRDAIISSGLPWRVRDNGTGIEMLLAPAGTFFMGCIASTPSCSSDESPTHEVTLTQPFYMGRYEVTQAQWLAKMGSNPSYCSTLFAYTLRFATILKTYIKNDQEVLFPEWYVFNQIKDLSSLNHLQVLNGKSHLIKSKGLLGIRKDVSNNKLSDVFNSSSYIYSPYYDSTSATVQDAIIDKSYLFGKDVVSSHSYNYSVTTYAQGKYVAVSAPAEGGLLATELGGNGSGAVYLYVRKNHELEFLQKLTYDGASLGVLNFGKKISFCDITVDTAAGEVSYLALCCAYLDYQSGTDKVVIYKFNGSIFLQDLDLFPQTESESTHAAFDQTQGVKSEIIGMYFKYGVLIITKNYQSSNLQFISIISKIKETGTTLIYGSFIKSVLTTPNVHLENNGICLLQESSGYSLAVGCPSHGTADVSIVDLTNILINSTSSASDIRHGAVFVFTISISGSREAVFFTVDSSSSVVVGKISEDFSGSGSNPSAYGYSIACNDKNIFISSPYDSSYSVNINTLKILKAGSVFCYGWKLEGSKRVIDVAKKQKITMIDINKSFGGKLTTHSVISEAFQYRQFGKALLLKGDKLISSACHDDTITGASDKISYTLDSKDVILPGQLYVISKDHLGSFSALGSLFNSCNNTISESSITNFNAGDRNGCSLSSIDLPGGGFILLSGASGFCPNTSVSGRVCVFVIPGDSAMGVSPSNKPSLLKEKYTTNLQPTEYTISSQCLGRRHVAVLLKEDCRYTWSYSPARLLEKSIIKSEVAEASIPKFKLAKFLKDPVTGLSATNTYSDIGAFSMNQDKLNTSGQTAGDISVSNLPIYDSVNYNLRVIEMHAKPYRILDASSGTNSASSISSASSDYPKQITNDDWKTNLDSNGSIVAYSPVMTPIPASGYWTGELNQSNTFAFVPLRADRWIVPMSEMTAGLINLYADKLSIKRISAQSFTYKYSNGYSVISMANMKNLDSTDTIYIGNPTINPKKQNTGEVALSWWKSGNLFSPGCIQIADSGSEGVCAIGNLLPFGGDFVAYPTYELQPFTNNSDSYLVYSTSTPVPTSSYQARGVSQLPRTDISSKADEGACIKQNDIWSYKIAEGSYICQLNDTDYLSATRKFLSWSSCCLDTLSAFNDSETPLATYDRSSASFDSIDFKFGHLMSLPPVYISLLDPSNQDKTEQVMVSRWGKNIATQGVKDPVIHGVSNYNKFLTTSGSSISHEYAGSSRSVMISFITGYGARTSFLENNNENISYFTPQIKFTCILDKYISRWDNWKRGFCHLSSSSSSAAGSNTGYNYSYSVPGVPDKIFANNEKPAYLSRIDSFGDALSRNDDMFRSCVAPTDTIYLIDLFYEQSDSLPNSDPIVLQKLIYKSCFTVNPSPYSVSGLEKTDFGGFETIIHGRNEGQASMFNDGYYVSNNTLGSYINQNHLSASGNALWNRYNYFGSTESPTDPWYSRFLPHVRTLSGGVYSLSTISNPGIFHISPWSKIDLDTSWRLGTDKVVSYVKSYTSGSIYSSTMNYVAQNSGGTSYWSSTISSANPTHTKK